MKIEEIMSPECKYLDENASVVDAAKMMAAEDFGAVPIANGNKLVGMLTDRDIVMRAVAQGCDPAKVKVSEMMSGKVYYCYSDDDIDEIADNMAELQVRRMPVVDREKNLVGFVSLGDLSVRGAKRDAGDALAGISQPADGATPQ